MSELDNLRRGELKRLLRHRGVPEIELHNAVEDIIAERRRWTAAALGRRINLTFDEKIQLGIRTIACVDRTKGMMRLYFRERKRERDRRRRRRNKMEAQIMRAKTVSPRAKELAAILTDAWAESGQLAEQMTWNLKDDALRIAIARASRELSSAGIVEIKYGPGKRGSRVLFVRKRPTIIAISAHRSIRNASEMRLSR